MLRRKTNQLDMLHGPLLSKIILFALPLMVTSTLQQIFNATDVAVVGQFAGSQALAAVGSNSPIINLIINLLIGLSMGANVVIANYIGQGRKDRIKDTVHTAILISLIGGVAFGVLGIFVSRPMLVAMGSPDDVIDLATLYLRIFFAGLPMMSLYNFCSSIMRSKGDTMRPLIALAISGVINVGLNLLLVAVFHMSVAGVAIATVTANTISAIMLVVMLVKEEGEFHLDFRKLRLHRDHFKRILQIGVPSGVQGMVFSLSNVFIQSAVNSFGSAAIAGSSAALTFEYFAYFALNAFVQAAMTFTSQNYGALEMKRCRDVYLRCMICGVIAVVICNSAFFFGRVFFIGLFTDSAEVAEWGYTRMACVLIFQWIALSYEVSAAAMRGMGHSTLPALITVIGTCLLRIAWVFTVFPKSHSFELLMHIYPITWTVTGIAMLIAYFVIRHKEEERIALYSLMRADL